MNWYSGDIGNAISESKNKKLIFLVYTFDSNSTEMNELWNRDQVRSLCDSSCISLRLEAESQACKQFTQIYAVSTYPTTYLIGNNGRPLEVIIGSVDEEELTTRINKAVESHGSLIKPNTTTTETAASTSNSQETATNVQLESEPTTSLVENEPKQSIEEKVALAKEKLRLIQEKKKSEEEERERNSEMERRRLGQEILKAKREKEELELRKIAEEKRREKQEDEIAKQRVKDRIQQDREEKQARYAKEKEELENVKKLEREKLDLAKQQEVEAERARLSQIARIQFRFVDGSSVVNQFDPNQLLEDARLFVLQKLKDMNESLSFSLHSSFPKKEYTSDDMKKSLRDLQLAPSAVLLVIPIRSKASKAIGRVIPVSASPASTSSVVSYASDFMSLIFLPFTIIWGIVGSLFGLTGSNNTSNSNNQSVGSTANQPSTSRNQQDQNNIRRRNIGGLNDRDDDNATWNGNSTQQM